MKDTAFTLLPQERVLDHRFPRPVMEKGYCHEYTGTWAPVEEQNRDPNTGDASFGALKRFVYYIVLRLGDQQRMPGLGREQHLQRLPPADVSLPLTGSPVGQAEKYL